MHFFKKVQVPSFIGVFLLASSLNVWAQQTVTLQPEQPQQGKTVTITYHPNSPGATIKSPDSLNLVLSYAPYQYSQPDHYAMKKGKHGWTATFPLSNEFKFASFYFTSGKKEDRNSDNHHYEFFAYKNNKPVEKAHLMKANSFSKRYKDTSDSLLANMKAGQYRKEIATYPNNYDAHMDLYAYQLKKKNADSTAIREKAHRLINKRLAEYPGSYMIISDVKSGYRQIGEKAMGDSVEKAMIKKYPESDIAMYDAFSKALDEKDKDKQTKMLLSYVNTNYKRSYINKYYTGYGYKMLFEHYAEQSDTDAMKKMADLWLKSNPNTLDNPIQSSDYNSAARTIAEKTNRYDLALQYAKTALKKTSKEPALTTLTTDGFIALYRPKDKREKYLKDRKAAILATMGLIYTKQQKYGKAESTLKKAEKMSGSQDTKKYMAALYEQTDRPKQAFDTYQELLMKAPTDTTFRAKLKENYIAYNGSEAGFEAKTKKINEAWRQKMIKEFNKKKLDKPAPSLAHATDLQKKVLNADNLKGKVVVLDFWATWCGPCNMAFPYVQKVYEKYKDNPRVAFLIMDSAWDNTIKQALEWQKKKDYTFPLYFDKGSKITTAYGVRGIPTTFVIGPKGNIQFKDIGYEGPSMEPKLALKIDMLLHSTDNDVMSSADSK